MLIIETLNANIQRKIKHLWYVLNSAIAACFYVHAAISNKWKQYAQIITGNTKKSARKDTKNKSGERHSELNKVDIESAEVAEQWQTAITKDVEIRREKNPYSFFTPQTFDANNETSLNLPLERTLHSHTARMYVFMYRSGKSRFNRKFRRKSKTHLWAM